MSLISRRNVLKGMGLTALGGGMGSQATAREKRPNFVFIYTDDQRWDAMSCMGHSWLETPNMDRLAEEGLLFENAFVTISLCGPSRASFLTGQYAHRHGVRRNESWDDPDPKCSQFPAKLHDAGYETAYIGKWHMDSQNANPRPGFDYWLSFGGQGRYFDPPLNEMGRDFKAKGYMTDLLTEYAVGFLGRQTSDKPFCMILSHKAVHEDFSPAPRHRDKYRDVGIPKPTSFDDTFEGKPEWLRASYVRGILKKDEEANKDRSVPDKFPRWQWNGHDDNWMSYYRALLAVDESVGRVYEKLKDMGELDNTVFVFSSDNGYFIGEHRRGDKRLAYEESIRIPMLVRYPKVVKAGSRRDEMVLNIDLAPTFLDLAGEPIPTDMQGSSWKPILEGKKNVDWRDSWFYTYYKENWCPGIPTTLAVRTEKWKYITFPDINDLDELYDLEKDPVEMQNLACDPQYAQTLADMKKELERLKKETEYTPMAL